jgi:hypothetical protein
VEQRTLAICACTLAFGLALFAVWFAFAIRALDCDAEAYSECSTEGRVQLWLALAGLVPAFLALAGSVFGRGRAGVWFVTACVVYAAWILFLIRWNS